MAGAVLSDEPMTDLIHLVEASLGVGCSYEQCSVSNRLHHHSLRVLWQIACELLSPWIHPPQDHYMLSSASHDPGRRTRWAALFEECEVVCIFRR